LVADANRDTEAQRLFVQREIEQGKIAAERALQNVRERADVAIRRVDDDLQRGRYVHTLQFEKEFLLYQDVWRQLQRVKTAALALLPVFDARPRGKTDDDLKSERLDAFAKEYNPFIDFVASQEPFFPAEVFNYIKALCDLLHTEYTDYSWGANRERGEAFPSDCWDRQDANVSAIVEQVEEIASAIRKRIGLLETHEPTTGSLAPTKTTTLAGMAP
jgi:hypothetical protein